MIQLREIITTPRSGVGLNELLACLPDPIADIHADSFNIFFGK